jgi:hypothetical protein
MAENVLFDPQFSLQKVLKPFRGFEATYQGQPGNLPIAFFRVDESPRDPDAGKPGFNADLLRYVDVAFGSLVCLWIPMCFFASGDQTFTNSYQFRVKWRMRNVTDFRNRRTPFHLDRQFPGAPDTSDAANPQRQILPAAYDDIELQQATPAAGPVDFNLRPRAYVVPSNTEILDSLPLLPGGASGVHQQGIFDPGAFGVGADVVKNAMFHPPKLFIAKGDQMIIEALKLPAQAVTDWDFTTSDLTFAKIYGADTPDGSGIYLFTAASPHQD